MSSLFQFLIDCMIAVKDERELLHIEVRSGRFRDQCYSRHYAYEELPKSIQFVFHNLAHVFVCMQRRETVYFDEQEAALKLCLQIAGEVKQFALPLTPYFSNSSLSKQKIIFYEQEKQRKKIEFQKMMEQKADMLKQLKRTQELLRAERKQKENELLYLNSELQNLTKQTKLLQRENEQKQKLIQSTHIAQNQKVTEPTAKNNKQIHPPSSQQPPLRQHYEQRKRFWIEQISRLKRQKLQQLKNHININTKFQQQVSLSINFIKLTKMLFVEIFINLQVLDLSNNCITFIEGLQNLAQLLKLNLSYNKVTNVSNLTNLNKLVQLIIKYNSIRKIQNIFHLTNLQILSLSGNKIQSVPDDISKLSRLVQLRLYQNRITSISQKVLLLKNIKILSVGGNKCYNEGSKYGGIINKLLKNGIKITVEEVEEINICQ